MRQISGWPLIGDSHLMMKLVMSTQTRQHWEDGDLPFLSFREYACAFYY